ncbi:MAG TPA: hypothetical protein VMU87_03660 [Stellaceae bacterium]|nr:hypothetical protein [Stellaceae bacterium]
MADTPEATARSLADSVAVSWEAQLGARLLSIALIGSLAHGGFSPRYSDIDMAVVAEGGLASEELALMRAEAAAQAPAHAAKLSLFWADRGFAVGRFPPLDRVDYVDHAVPLFARELVPPPRPTRDDIRTYLRGQPFASWAQAANAFAEIDELGPADHKPFIRALLYPARFVYSWTTGAMGSNDDAVAFLDAHAPPGLDVDLVVRALRCRREARDPDSLFAERAALLRQRDACSRLIAASG